MIKVSSVKSNDYEKSTKMFEVIIEDTRNQIVAYFYFFKELKAKDLIRLTGKVNSTIIHHLQILQKSGIIYETRVVWKERYYQLTREFLKVYQNQLSVFNRLRKKEPERALEFYKNIIQLTGKSASSVLFRFSKNLTDINETFTEHNYKGTKQPDNVTHGVAFRKEVYEEKVRPLIDEILILMDEEQRIYGDEEVSFEKIMGTVNVRILSLPTKMIFPKDLNVEDIGPTVN
ncbi:MAG: winged helix-turn-helix domain-containing protein [Candidatus Heimdallarchaeaceae archaeon]